MGAPYPKVRLPDNFVPRIEAFDAVRRKLLAETACPLVVSRDRRFGRIGEIGVSGSVGAGCGGANQI